MSDIIEYAENAVKSVRFTGNDIIGATPMILELIEALKAARAENYRHKHPPRATIRTWSACYISDPPELSLPIGGTTYTFPVDDVWVLHHICEEFLLDCKEHARLNEQATQ